MAPAGALHSLAPSRGTTVAAEPAERSQRPALAFPPELLLRARGRGWA